jgi:hypothetical protein
MSVVRLNADSVLIQLQAEGSEVEASIVPKVLF